MDELMRPSQVQILLTRVVHDPVVTEVDAELFAASAAGDIQTMQSIFENGAFRIDRAHTPHGRTALHSAVRNGQAEAVGLLLAHRCHVDPTAGGWTPLMNAAFHGPSIEIMALLLGARADPSLRVPRPGVRGGVTALDIAALEHKVDAREVLNLDLPLCNLAQRVLSTNAERHPATEVVRRWAESMTISDDAAMQMFMIALEQSVRDQ